MDGSHQFAKIDGHRLAADNGSHDLIFDFALQLIETGIAAHDAMGEFEKLKAREVLLSCATRISDVLTDDDDVSTTQKVYAEMVREAGGRVQLLDVLRRAGVAANNPVQSLVRAFPDFFRLEGKRVRFIGD
jgi:hypothetical protein